MATNYNPRIITDGLVLCLDAGNTKSYPGSGTTWTDLSGNGNNGTLVNGVGFNGSNGGSLSFDGVDDYILLSDTNFGNFGTSNFTISSWVKISETSGAKGVISKYEPHSSNGSGWFMSFVNDTIQVRITQDITSPLEISSISATISKNVWYNITMKRDTNKFSLFINGQLYQEKTTNNIINCSNSSSVLSIGAGYRYANGATGYYHFGNISSGLIYNKALTASEVQQNFNATRSRYGI